MRKTLRQDPAFRSFMRKLERSGAELVTVEDKEEARHLRYQRSIEAYERAWNAPGRRERSSAGQKAAWARRRAAHKPGEPWVRRRTREEEEEILRRMSERRGKP